MKNIDWYNKFIKNNITGYVPDKEKIAKELKENKNKYRKIDLKQKIEKWCCNRDYYYKYDDHHNYIWKIPELLKPYVRALPDFKVDNKYIYYLEYENLIEDIYLEIFDQPMFEELYHHLFALKDILKTHYNWIRDSCDASLFYILNVQVLKFLLFHFRNPPRDTEKCFYGTINYNEILPAVTTFKKVIRLEKEKMEPPLSDDDKDENLDFAFDFNELLTIQKHDGVFAEIYGESYITFKNIYTGSILAAGHECLINYPKNYVISDNKLHVATSRKKYFEYFKNKYIKKRNLNSEETYELIDYFNYRYYYNVY